MIKVKQIKDLAVTIQKAEEKVKQYADKKFEPIINKKSAFNKDFGSIEGTVAEGNHTHGIATQLESGFISVEDKVKLDGIEQGANNYIHPTGNGHLHLPNSQTSNNGDFLKVVDSVSGRAEWTSITFADLQNLPNTLEGYGITDAASKSETEKRFETIEKELRTEEVISESDIDYIINFIEKREK